MIGQNQITRAVTAARNIAVQEKHKRTHLKIDKDNPVYNTNPLETTSQRIKRWVSEFGTNVKQYLDAHRDRAKKQREIPMPRWGEK
tara:strand:- start:151 stop:408 length:258 start_codon:yes stop_codon:yes gene_type:complete